MRCVDPRQKLAAVARMEWNRIGTEPKCASCRVRWFKEAEQNTVQAADVPAILGLVGIQVCAIFFYVLSGTCLRCCLEGTNRLVL